MKKLLYIFTKLCEINQLAYKLIGCFKTVKLTDQCVGVDAMAAVKCKVQVSVNAGNRSTYVAVGDHCQPQIKYKI